MEIDLTKISMFKGQQYETIITTINDDGSLNAAPIGILCRGKDKVMCRIFKGSHTLENIISQKEFIVNICENPELFTWSLLDNLEKDDFSEDQSIKNVDAYFKCKVTSIKEAVKQSDPVKKKSEANVIKADVCKLIIRNPVKAYNRSFSYVVECLANFSRIDIVDDEKRKYYLDSFKEARRVVKKVGSKQDKEAMDMIKSKLNEKGYDI
ncbi:DUF447 domain-containing protein [Methanobrevibacter millerae]|uniref:DUF447 family protein n=1 Tax=Methanobrevibacter millerae TaxID=230361 RepID=A0A0U3CZ82_9EURY|nr:DUF447 domain-containing protein [Methanobrevibacter millerae]ALT69588.1 hypothetical protein sm9_1821 [Methanobrevibacter millerae]MBO6111202.1 DUF447 family protein [Methanobrevibacter sp.]MBO6275467.1 DUF447 family protein [Methanobrevibacter sp.]